MNENKTTKLISVALVTAAMAIVSQLSIPLPSGIPITLQTLAVAFAGYLLGAKYGTVSVGVYIALGAMGAPVFTGFTGGFHKFVSPTGGFIWGFLLLALACGASNIWKWQKHEKLFSLLLGVAGILLCHLCGIIQFSAFTQSNPVASAIVCSIPYLPKDIACAVAAYFLAHAVKKRMR